MGKLHFFPSPFPPPRRPLFHPRPWLPPSPPLVPPPGPPARQNGWDTLTLPPHPPPPPPPIPHMHPAQLFEHSLPPPPIPSTTPSHPPHISFDSRVRHKLPVPLRRFFPVRSGVLPITRASLLPIFGLNRTLLQGNVQSQVLFSCPILPIGEFLTPLESSFFSPRPPVAPFEFAHAAGIHRPLRESQVRSRQPPLVDSPIELPQPPHLPSLLVRRASTADLHRRSAPFPLSPRIILPFGVQILCISYAAALLRAILSHNDDPLFYRHSGHRFLSFRRAAGLLKDYGISPPGPPTFVSVLLRKSQ